jgi:hypothetical protein
VRGVTGCATRKTYVRGLNKSPAGALRGGTREVRIAFCGGQLLCFSVQVWEQGEEPRVAPRCGSLLPASSPRKATVGSSSAPSLPSSLPPLSPAPCSFAVRGPIRVGIGCATSVGGSSCLEIEDDCDDSSERHAHVIPHGGRSVPLCPEQQAQLHSNSRRAACGTDRPSVEGDATSR